MLFREFKKYTFQFFIEDALHLISFILCWVMNIQNNIITPVMYNILTHHNIYVVK
jgi:hypothetical protein